MNLHARRAQWQQPGPPVLRLGRSSSSEELLAASSGKSPGPGAAAASASSSLTSGLNTLQRVVSNLLTVKTLLTAVPLLLPAHAALRVCVKQQRQEVRLRKAEACALFMRLRWFCCVRGVWLICCSGCGIRILQHCGIQLIVCIRVGVLLVI